MVLVNVLRYPSGVIERIIIRYRGLHVVVVGINSHCAAPAGNHTVGGVWTFLDYTLRLSSRPVFVFGIFQHVLGSKAFRLIDEWPFVGVREFLPLDTEPLRDLGVVHLWVVLCHFSTLISRPNLGKEMEGLGRKMLKPRGKIYRLTLICRALYK